MQNHSQKLRKGRRRKAGNQSAVSPAEAAGFRAGQERLSMRPLAHEPRWSNVPIGPRALQPVRLTYSSYVTLTTASGVAGVQAVSGNSLNDPDATGSGGQPTFFDQFAAMYYYYRVYRSTIEVRVAPTSNSPSAADVVLFPDVNNTISEGQILECRRLKYCQSKIVQPSNGGNNVVTMSAEMDTGTMFGQRQIDDDNFAALSSANPTDRWYWLIGVQSIGGLTSALAHTVEYTVTYYAVMEDVVMEPGDSAKPPRRAFRPPRSLVAPEATATCAGLAAQSTRTGIPTACLAVPLGIPPVQPEKHHCASCQSQGLECCRTEESCNVSSCGGKRAWKACP